MKLSDFEDWKEILGTGKDFGDRNSLFLAYLSSYWLVRRMKVEITYLLKKIGPKKFDQKKFGPKTLVEKYLVQKNGVPKNG